MEINKGITSDHYRLFFQVKLSVLSMVNGIMLFMRCRNVNDMRKKFIKNDTRGIKRDNFSLIILIINDYINIFYT